MNIRLMLITYELDQMSKYLDLVLDSLQQHFEGVEEFYRKEMMRDLTEDEWAILDGSYMDDLIEAGENLPQLLLSGFVVTWYSFVEQKLTHLCQSLELSTTINQESFTRDKGIRKARKLLKHSKGYMIDEQQWQKLVMIGKFRNLIVHEGNNLPFSYHKPDKTSVSHTLENGIPVYLQIDDSLFEYMKKQKILKFSSSTSVELNPTFEYCQQLIKFGKEMFEQLYRDMFPGRIFETNLFSESAPK